jgi:aryl-alcohol dehydrogenase-like predicted oxidoreductase
MRYIELAPGVRSSALGFGCSSIMGSVDATTSRLAITEALDCGITHFDLARSYGYGQAEKFVGKFLKSQRDRVTIVTKFGIAATPLASAFTPIKPLIRVSKKFLSYKTQSTQHKKQELTNKLPAIFLKRLPITPALMISSLEKSLQQLGTDYVDILLIHEPIQTLNSIDELFEKADELVSAGKIRSLGLSYMKDQESIHASYINRFVILQSDLNVASQDCDLESHKRRRLPNIFFSPFRGCLSGQRPSEILNQISIDFPQSVTLCSMFNRNHIRLNSSIFDK